MYILILNVSVGGFMKSVWNEKILPEFPSLEEDIKTDVAIVGGGLAGILTAYFLKKRGVDCVVIEKDRICSGNTGRTTAKITYQHGLIYDKLISKYGINVAAEYLAANKNALDEYKKLCASISCDFEIKDAFVYSKNGREKIEKEAEAYSRLGVSADIVDEIPIPVKNSGAVRVRDQAQFNPIKFVFEISKGLTVYEHTFARKIGSKKVITDKGTVTAEKIVCATHFPVINKHGSYFLKMYQHRSYVIALSNAPDVGGMYIDEEDTGLSFRNYNGFLFLGGGGGRTGKQCREWRYLRELAEHYYPESSVEYYWAAQDCMSLDGIPYIGNYSLFTPDIYVETGFNKWGMTGSMAAARIVSDAVTGKKNGFAEAFSPSRSILTKQLLINGCETAKNLLTPSPRVCPHLGCALKWNRAEHSWDCPCHGSRFTEDGALLDVPSMKNLKKK